MNTSDCFQGTAPFYARWRPGYPDAVFDLIVRRFDLDGQGRLLDVGTGTGQLALPLAQHFEKVVGLDPEPEMLRHAAMVAEQHGLANATWIEGDAGHIGPQLGTFRLVTIGRAFHWMERDDVLSRLHSVIQPGGGLAVVDDDTPLERARTSGATIAAWSGGAVGFSSRISAGRATLSLASR